MTVRFLFDYVSPYAYLAWTQIHALAARHGRDVEPIPVLFAGLLAAHGTLGPAEVPAKRVYMWNDVLRTAQALDVPIALPPAHPWNPLFALRVSTLDLEPSEKHRLVECLFRASWAEGRDLTDPGVVARLASAAGLDGARLVADAGDADVKARLRAATDAAIAAGVFGVPMMVVDGEMFWGIDSLGHLERWLRGEGRVDAARLAAFHGLAPSAVRGRRGGG